MLAVTGAQPGAFDSEDEQRLMEFGDLLATAIASIEDRAKLATQATTDPLTGLANHRALQQRLAAEAARAARHDTPLSVAVIDIDHFKQINDSARHETGDEVLVQVARCLTGLARAEDTLGRVGGDEIAWMLPDTTRGAGAAGRRARAPPDRRDDGRALPDHRVGGNLRHHRDRRSLAADRSRRRGAVLEQGPRSRSVLDLRPNRDRRALGPAARRTPRALAGAASACAPWPGRSTPRTRRPAGIPNGWRSWAPSWPGRSAGRPSGPNCSARRRWCTTSARSASRTPCCASRRR